MPDLPQKRRRRKGEGTIRRDPKTGRWRGRLRFDGKLHWVSGADPDDVSTKLAKLRVSLIAGKQPTNTRETIAAYLDRWLPLQTKLEHSTYRTYAGLIKNHIKPGIGRIRLTKLSPLQVQEWINDREKAGLSPRTIEQARAVLRVALSAAERWELVERNVAKLVELPSKRKREVKPLTPEEARSLLSAIRGDRLEALYLTAIATGLRQGELLGLRWEYDDDGELVRDVDLEAGTLTVRYALARLPGKWILKRPKTEKSRRVLVLPSIVRAALIGHRDRQGFEAKDKKEWNPRGLVFVRTDGEPIVGTTVTKAFQHILREANLPRQRFHDLRHGAASLWIAQGATLQDVADALGHSDITMVSSTYGHIYDQARRQMASRMDEILGG